mmetsp:Transcript_21474/g.66993  ORF Transcript_21474/g.66993 Transcript_21474/m.66993 type:complete len:246 (-) Transcript_21474:370-1107(-)
MPAVTSLLRRHRKRGRKGRGKERASIVQLKVGAEEVPFPLLPHLVLLFEKLAQAAEVRGACVGGHEKVALVAPVGKVGVEQGPEQIGVLGSERRPGVVAQAGPEGLAEGDARVRVERLCAVGLLLRRRRHWEVEAVEVEVHAPGLARRWHHAGKRRKRDVLPGLLRERRSAEERFPAELAHGLLKAELHAPIDAVPPRAHALLHVHELAVLHADLAVAALVPELRDLQGAAALCLLLGRLEPRIL